MSDIECFSINRKCPKCEDPNASVLYQHGDPPHKPLIIRTCSLCGYVRKELPLDDPDC